MSMHNPDTPTHAPADPNATVGGEPAAPDRAPPSAAGDRYRIGDEIARGGMGAVFRATDSALGRDVAVKVLLDRYAPTSATARRFLDEARITGQLQHPGIPPVHDLGTLPNGRPFLAMKLIKGETLDDLLKARRDPSAERGRWLGVFEKVCEAVAYAHAHDVLHRDLKPQNVMVGAFGEVQVMDWGLAKVLHPLSREAESSGPDPEATAPNTAIVSQRDSDDLLTQAGSVLGTPAYMPPEQAIGAVDQIDRRSDVFGLGGILASILTGKPPFIGGTPESTRQLAATRKLGDCFARLDGCGAEPDLIALAKRCLAGEKDDRPTDGNAVATEVAALRAAADERARRAELDAAEGKVREAEGRKRRRVAMTLGGLILAAIAAAGVQWVWRKQSARAAEQERTVVAERALAEVTAEQQRTQQALYEVTAARAETVGALRAMTDEFVLTQFEQRPQVTMQERQYLQRVLALWRSVAATRGDSVTAQTLRADGAFRVGVVLGQLGQVADAEAAYRAALALWEKLTADFPARPEYQLYATNTLTNLGIVLANAGRTVDAEASHRAALATRSKLATEFPAQPDYRSELAATQHNLGNLFSATGRITDAESAYRASLSILNQLTADFPARPDYQQKLANTQDGLGQLLDAVGRLADAEAAYRLALGIREKLATDSPVRPDYRQELAATQCNLGAVLVVTGSTREAETAYRAASAAYERLAADFPARPDYRNGLALARYNLGKLLSTAGRTVEAEITYRASLSIYERLSAEFPTHPAYTKGLAHTGTNLGVLPGLTHLEVVTR